MTNNLDWMKPRFAELRAWLDTKPNLCAGLFELPDALWVKLSGDVAENNGWFSLEANVVALNGSEPDCLVGTSKVLEILAHGHRTLIRVRPEVTKETNFETGTTMVRGYVRFAVHENEGDWRDVDKTVWYGLFGK